MEVRMAKSVKTFLWIEDREGKSGHTFWKTLMQELYPDVIVESKKNSSELVKAVKLLTDDKNHYIIVLDDSFDNMQVYQEQKRLKKYAGFRTNVKLISIICFEYILLEFTGLLDWIFAPDDVFYIKRKKTICAREKLIEVLRSEKMQYKLIKEIVEYDVHITDHNIEQLCTKLLFDLTRNTGFEVTKGKIGECWIRSCCEWTGRQRDDLCGLDDKRLTVSDKMKEIYTGTLLKEKFLQAGMEAVW